MALPFEYFQECSKPILVVDDMKDEHVVAFPFEKGQLDERNRCLFSNFQERGVFHVFEDSFANMLQSSKNVKLAMFSDQGYHFQLEFELPLPNVLCLLKEGVSKIPVSNHLI